MNSQGTQSDHEQKYSSFEGKDKESLRSLLFDALRIQPFDQVERLVDRLLGVGVPATIKDEAGSIPLSVAVKQKCSVNVIERLMVCTNLESLLESQNKHKLTPIHEAVLVDNHEALQVMINKLRGGLPLEINRHNREEQIRSHHYGLLDKASNHYKILNKKNKDGWTALHYAANRGHVDVLHILVMLEQCNVIVCNKNKKQTAFHLAAKGGYLPCLRLLFVAVQCRGLLGSLPKVDKNEWNLACHASAHTKGDVEVMEWLLRNMPEHSDINHCTKKGYTPFLLACEYLNVELVKLLLNHEQLSEVTAVTDDGKTALHLAAIHDSVEIVRLLLDKGFPVNDTDKKYGETALHIACKKGSDKVEKVLITEGADQTIMNKYEKLRPQEVKYNDLRIPAEIKKRGDEAVKGYIAALRKGKKKMPRCKLVILGEAGVGKTNLLNLLTGEKFVPTHERTEGVDISLVATFDIDTKTWRKNSGGGGDDEYRRIAATEVASQLKVTKPDDKDSVLPTPESLEQKFNLIMRKYAESKPKLSLKPATRHMAHFQSTKYQHVDDHVQTPEVRFAEQPIVFESEPSAPLKSDAKATEKHSITVRVHSTNPQSSSHTRSQHDDTAVSLVQSSSSFTQHMDAHTAETQAPSEATDISGSHDHFYTIILREASKQKSSEPLTLHLKLTSFDFAGQEHYKSMHPCFMTSRAVYVVTFNARHLLPEAGFEYQCVEEINYWVNSVLVHVSTDPRVILVGTHRGPYDGADGFNIITEEQQSYINKSLKKHLKNQSVFKFFKGDRIMALVESSIENKEDISGAKVVREKLQSLGEGHPGNKDDLPLSYLRLESKIFEERSKNKSFLIPHGEVKQWANEFGIEDLKTALDFLHDIGIIVNPSCLPTLFLTKEDMEPLQGVVLIKPQWLADVMKELMKIDRGEKKFESLEREVNKAIECLLKTGKADKKLVLFPLWQEHHNGSKQLFEQICLLLEAYGVIIPIKKENEIAQCYYISCKLPQSENIPETSKNCHSFHVSFKDGLFPPFVLHQLMFKMYQDYNPSKYEFGKTECYMEYIKDCQWWLYQHSYDDVIKVAIRTKSTVRTILPALQLLDGMLQKILKAEELNSICYELGPVAVCSQCTGEQFFSYITYKNKTDPQEQSHISDCLQCSKCKNEVMIKCNSETDEIIKSKKYGYGKKIEEFKKDLNYDGLDDKLRDHLIEQFQMDLPKCATGASDSKIIQTWYREHRDDPWPLVVAHLSCYDDHTKDFEIDRIKCKFLYMCDHCL